jgi:hypothetical protein
MEKASTIQNISRSARLRENMSLQATSVSPTILRDNGIDFVQDPVSV